MVLSAAMLLLERLKLRILSGNYAYQDLCVFVVTCCGESMKVWNIVFGGEEKDEGHSDRIQNAENGKL